MKIGFLGLDLQEGKVKYRDRRLAALVEKFLPAKTTPFFVEFVSDNFTAAEALLVNKKNALDLFILDMDKLDTRAQRTSDAEERQLIKKCLKNLEEERPLCDVEFSAPELSALVPIAPLSFKPTLLVEDSEDINLLIEEALAKAGIIFFYTAGKKEVRAWPVRKDSDIVTCAGKIHSDLARGFIKADVVNFSKFENEHNLQSARSKGLVDLVGRDYIIRDGDIIEIRFNV